MDKFKKVLLTEVEKEFNAGLFATPQVIALINKVYNEFNFSDAHGTCKVGDSQKP